MEEPKKRMWETEPQTAEQKERKKKEAQRQKEEDEKVKTQEEPKNVKQITGEKSQWRSRARSGTR